MFLMFYIINALIWRDLLVEKWSRQVCVSYKNVKAKECMEEEEEEEAIVA